MTWLIALLVALALLVVYFGICGVIAALAAMPSRVPPGHTPASLGLAYEDVAFPGRADRVQLRGWYITGGDNGTIIVVHGGKQNRADATMKLLELCAGLARSGYNVLAFDRRGCGESERAPRRSASRFEWDVGGAVDYVEGRGGGPVYLLGVSIGAVACLLLARDEGGINGVVSDGCFASISELSGQVLGRISKLMLPFTWGSLIMGRLVHGLRLVSAIDVIGSVDCPVLFVHGEGDAGVPAEDARRLFEVSSNPGDELWVVPGAGHSQSYSKNPEQYIARVTSFLARKCGAGGPGAC